jgi:hypothetical protein
MRAPGSPPVARLIWTTDENQGSGVSFRSEFGPVSGDGSAAEAARGRQIGSGEGRTGAVLAGVCARVLVVRVVDVGERR